MKYIALFLLFVVSYSCRYPREIRQVKNKCKGVFRFVENNWSYDEEKDIYVPTEEFVKRFDFYGIYPQCLHGLSRDEAQLLFGRANEIHSRGLAYYYEAYCHENGSSCEGIKISLDKNGKIQDFYQGIIWYKSH